MAIILSLSILLVGCERGGGEDGMMTSHEVYTELVQVGAFPPALTEDIQEVLDDSSSFRMMQYHLVDNAIAKHCGQKVNFLADMLLRAMYFYFPVDMKIFNQPFIAIQRQIEAANTCVFNPLTKYLEE